MEGIKNMKTIEDFEGKKLKRTRWRIFMDFMERGVKLMSHFFQQTSSVAQSFIRASHADSHSELDSAQRNVKRDHWITAGLRNEGNTCFRNSILQVDRRLCLTHHVFH